MTDASCDPAAGGCQRPKATVRLTDGAGNIAPGVKIDKVRQLVLKEHEGMGGPLEVLVNNTKWNGLHSPSIAAEFPADGISELPQPGAIELWEIINLTMDAHPMHTHLVQFQIVNRESFDVDGTQGPTVSGGYVGFDNGIIQIPGAWAKAFDTTNPFCDNLMFDNPCPAFGPPLSYTTPNADGALGGNPAISPFLLKDVAAPKPEESGWKDMAKAFPGQVTRLLVRWAPTGAPQIPNKSLAGVNRYPFDPTTGPGYVWHCHIIDHEDNEMMRPYKVHR